MSSPNNTNFIAQSNASAINGTANPAANANAVARGPAFGAAAGSDRPLDTSEAIDNNKPKQPFQDAFLEALKTAVGGANRFVYKDHSADHPEVRLLCSVVEDLPGQFGAGVDEVPEAMCAAYAFLCGVLADENLQGRYLEAHSPVAQVRSSTHYLCPSRVLTPS